VALMSDLVSRVRLELGDLPKEFNFVTTADGNTKDFYLNAKPVEPYTLYVTVLDCAVPAPSGYKLEKDQGILHFREPLDSGNVLNVHGVSYRYFTDSDIERFINTAIDQHTHERTDKYGTRVTIKSIEPVEEYPIAILAVIEALWALSTDAAFDINIMAPDGVMIPRSQRYEQLTNMVNQRWEQYKQLCAALNIGLWRIQIGTLRRTSRRTNKLVPIYIGQEIDDSRKPERVWLPNDVLGYTPPPTTAEVYDIVMYQGDYYEQIIDFAFDVTGLDWKAEIRTYPNSPARYATFDVTILNAAQGRIKISLNSDKTKYLPVRAFWDLQATRSNDPTWEHTYLKGQVFVTQQVTVD
jgi:hypothetical protein